MKDMLVQIIGLRAAVIAGMISAGTAEGVITKIINDFNQEILNGK